MPNDPSGEEGHSGGPSDGKSPLNEVDENAPSSESAASRWAELQQSVDAIARKNEVPVEFPSTSITETTQITRKRSFKAWSGKPERLGLIAALIEDALKRAFEDAKPVIEKSESYARKSLVEGFALEARVIGGQGRIERKGALATILAEMDPREIERVELGNHPSLAYGAEIRAEISVTFGPDHRYRTFPDGVQLEITGADRHWVAGTSDMLIGEIAKNVPWWAHLRGSAALWIYGFVILALAAAAEITWGPKEVSVALGLATGIASGAAALGIHVASKRWMFPDFELLESGERSRARRVGGAIGLIIGLVGSVVGIVAYLQGR